MTPGTDLPPTCEVLGLVCFGPGAHKDGREYYSPAACARIPENFRRLAGHTTPRAKYESAIPGTAPEGKIGHDREQLVAERLKRSMGFLSVGKVTRCDPVPGFPGYVEIDIRGVPTKAVGGEIAADRINGVSVELLPSIKDPDDPSRTIEGPILTGVAFLGEELPAVRNWPAELRERAKPRATFADGRPVPPNPDVPAEWREAMDFACRSVAAKFAAQYDPARRTLRLRGHEYAARVACFSDFSPEDPAMTHEEIKAKLAEIGLTPEQVAAACCTPAPAADAMAAPAPGAPAGPPPAAVPPSGAFAAFAEKLTDPDQKAAFAAYADDVEKRFAEMTKRFGEVAAATDEAKKKDEAAQMAAFSERVEEALKPVYRKLPPVVIEKVHKPALLALRTATFSAEADRVKAFSEYVENLTGLPDDPRLVKPSQPDAAARPLSPLQARMLHPDSVLARHNPALAKKLREAAAV